MSELIRNPAEFREGNQHFLLEGPAGVLEVLTTTPKKVVAKGIGIICHPHPLHDGAMTNKVVHTISKAFDLKGLKTVRFNFRGVGQSEGEFADGLGETDDLIAVLHWVKRTCPDLPIWLGGFSFGALVAARGAKKIPIQQLLTVAPAVTRCEYQTLDIVHCPWLVIQGEEDEVIAAESVYQWFEEINNQPGTEATLVKVPEASHFFHGKLIELRQLILDNFIER